MTIGIDSRHAGCCTPQQAGNYKRKTPASEIAHKTFLQQH